MNSGKSVILAVLILSLFSRSCASTPKDKSVAEKPAQVATPAAAKGSMLADMHTAKQVGCEACHGTVGNVVDDNEQPVNANCVKCHITHSNVGKKTTGHINPHKSHLGEINCTTCHHGHTP